MSNAANGRTLELFFVDGRPEGMLTAEVFNWTGHLLKTPRTQLSEALKRDEAKRAGVYLLFGEDNDGTELAYIGEAEDVGKRIKDHDVGKEWWTSAILITSAGNKLNKAYIKYLEARLVQLAKKLRRSILKMKSSRDPPASGKSIDPIWRPFLRTYYWFFQQ